MDGGTIHQKHKNSWPSGMNNTAYNIGLCYTLKISFWKGTRACNFWWKTKCHGISILFNDLHWCISVFLYFCTVSFVRFLKLSVLWNLWEDVPTGFHSCKLLSMMCICSCVCVHVFEYSYLSLYILICVFVFVF